VGAVRRRILFLSHYGLPHLGGMEVVIDAAARELARRGHEVCHLASSAVNSAQAGDPPAGYRVLRLPALNVLETRLGVPYPLFGPGSARALAREVARADVVHAHGFLYEPCLAGLALARRRRPSAVRVLSEHVGHVEYASRVLDRVEAAAIASLGRFAACSAQALVTMNPKVAGELAALAPGRPLELIANGVDSEANHPPAPGERESLRAALGWDDGTPRVLFVGRLVAKKGVDAAVAAARAADGAFELILVGPGEPPRDLSGNVRALGPVAPARVAELMRAADAFLLPSRGEGFPVTAQEAMASGLPVVLAEDPAYAQHVEGAGAGVRLVRPEPAALAAAVRELLDTPDAGAQAAEHARRRFSWPAAIDAHEVLYDRLASLNAAVTSAAVAR